MSKIFYLDVEQLEELTYCVYGQAIQILTSGNCTVSPISIEQEMLREALSLGYTDNYAAILNDVCARGLIGAAEYRVSLIKQTFKF